MLTFWWFCCGSGELGQRCNAAERATPWQIVCKTASEGWKLFMAVRILLVDDHPVVRQGLRTLLEGRSEWEVVGEASDGIEALEKVGSLQPDVVVLDVTMPRMNGIEACRLIQQKIKGFSLAGSQGLNGALLNLGFEASAPEGAFDAAIGIKQGFSANFLRAGTFDAGDDAQHDGLAGTRRLSQGLKDNFHAP